MKILILGGYGTFGGRLAQLLADDPRLTLLIAGRSLAKAQAFCKKLPAGAEKLALTFDRNQEIEPQLRTTQPDLVVDATGPFQIYGDDPYRMIKACLATQVNYMDLADGSEFVKQVDQFDAEAKARNIYILSGVSSFPVLTAAVVRRLTNDWSKVNTIRGGIAPSPYAGVGLNVIRAITSYAGQRLPLVHAGEPSFGYALTETMRCTVGPPGYVPLKNTLFSLVDVPDLRVLPELWPEVEEVWMGAGPVPEILHRMLIGLSWLVRRGLLPTLLPFAALFHFVINILRWGEHRGGMFVAVQGLDKSGNPIEHSWHLLAEGNDGPFIPSMAIEALVKRALKGTSSVPGARPATTDLELEDYEEVFQHRTIYTGQRADSETISQPIYQNLLGSAWDALPEPIQKLHTCKEASGAADIDVSQNVLARLASKLLGFPAPGKEVPVRISFEATPGREVWHRKFGKTSFETIQTAGQGRADKLLSEAFGPIGVDFALVVSGERLHLVPRRWSLLGIPMPLALAPIGSTYEYVKDGKFHFHVEMTFPWGSPLIRYQGWLVPIS